MRFGAILSLKKTNLHVRENAQICFSRVYMWTFFYILASLNDSTGLMTIIAVNVYLLVLRRKRAA